MASILLAYNEAEFLNGPLKIIPGKHIFIHLTYRALQSWHYFEHKSAILDFGILAKASSLLGEHGLIFGGQTQICAIRARHFHRGRLLRQQDPGFTSIVTLIMVPTYILAMSAGY